MFLIFIYMYIIDYNCIYIYIYKYVVELKRFSMIEIVQYDIFVLYPSIS